MHLHTLAHACTRMHTLAHACTRLHTLAHARMHTHAHVMHTPSTRHMHTPCTRHMHMPCTPTHTPCTRAMHASCICHATRICHAKVHMPRHPRCADYGVVSGYNDDFPQREAWVIGATSRCCPLMACRHGGVLTGGGAPLCETSTRIMFQC
jgi:hypothetical protein